MFVEDKGPLVLYGGSTDEPDINASSKLCY